MVDIADVAALGAAIGDEVRAEMLGALMGGEAQTATELAAAARVAKPTASFHLAKLVDAGLLAVEVQGRHRYFRIADRRVARLIEQMMGIVEQRAPRQFGPRDEALRKARVCYDHLAGDLGVHVHDSMQAHGMLEATARGLELSAHGLDVFGKLGVDLDAAGRSRRPLCRSCLDWSVRRHHLAGSAGAALLARFLELGWARRSGKSRTLVFSATGERALRRAFPA